MTSNAIERSAEETATEFADSQGLEYSATFVPLSQSRNSGNPNLTLNWRITISKGQASITTDYQQGIAHLPGYKFVFGRRVSVDEHKEIARACEEGDYYKHGGIYADSKRRKIEPPKLVDVMFSLVMDSSAIDAGCFEEWASEFGYDTDSISARDTYDQCIAIALKLRQIIDLDEAREAFQDY